MTTPKTRPVVDLMHLRDEGLLAGFNELVAALGQAGLVQHHAPTTEVSTPDATDDTTLIALANALTTAYEAHRVDTDAHVAADSTNALTATTTCTTQAHARTRINDMKIKLNAHIIRAAAHRGVPPFGGHLDAIATADAADQGGSYVEADVDSIGTLANETKTVANRAAAGKFITLVDGSDDTTDYALANQIKAVLNRHGAGVSSLVLTPS